MRHAGESIPPRAQQHRADDEDDEEAHIRAGMLSDALNGIAVEGGVAAQYGDVFDHGLGD